jgi:membrane protease YdiL (CAAX protease family)
VSAAAERAPRGRVAAWAILIGVLAAINYIGRFTAGKPPKDALYDYSTAVGGVVEYAILFGITYAIVANRPRELFALRPPRTWGAAVGGVVAVLIGLSILSAVLSPVLEPGKEQGLAPDRWQPAHAGAYVANFVVIALIAPVVEELIFRGAGFSLLEQFGRPLAIVVVGVAFGLAHGLVEALPLLAAFGIGLAWIRARTDSVYPGMAAHALFNGAALILSVTT